MGKKCLTCRFNSEEFDGDVEQNYDGTCSGAGQWAGICAKGQDNHYKEGGMNCKRYDSIKTKCNGCNKIFSITELSQGFCSKKCKTDFIEHVKKSVENDTRRLAKINERIKKLESVKNIRANEIELMSLQGELQGIEHYIEEGKDILKRLGIAI